MYCEALIPLSKSKLRQGTIAGLVFDLWLFSVRSLWHVWSLVLFLFAVHDTSLLAVMFAAFGIGQVNAAFDSKRKGLAAAARMLATVDEPLDDDGPLSNEGQKPASLDGTILLKANFISPYSQTIRLPNVEL